ncbi:MAG: hypothetical protein FJ137_16635, partial [Deltaproteobacteria bacterium]|nr:hypothetical protein [Deltaproteobacteria bacterium]
MTVALVLDALVLGSSGCVDDAGGDSGPPPAEPPPSTANLLVDADHDGEVAAADDAVEDEQRATFLANVDDDNGDGQRDRQDRTLNPLDEDMTEVVVQRVRGLKDARVFVAVSPRQA